MGNERAASRLTNWLAYVQPVSQVCARCCMHQKEMLPCLSSMLSSRSEADLQLTYGAVSLVKLSSLLVTL